MRTANYEGNDLASRGSPRLYLNISLESIMNFCSEIQPIKNGIYRIKPELLKEN